MIRAILFDYDDTLVKATTCVFSSLKETGKRYYNLDIKDEEIKKIYGKPYVLFLTEVFRYSDTPENIKINYEKVRREFHMELFPDTLPTLNELLKKYAVGIVTAAGRDIVMYDLNRLNFPIDSLTYIQTAEDTKIHKPDPHVFDHILEVLKDKNISKDEIMYVGDSIKDYYAAYRGGLADFYGIARGFTTKEEFKKEGVKTIDLLSDLPILLNS